jgi:hypothetical protein
MNPQVICRSVFCLTLLCVVMFIGSGCAARSELMIPTSFEMTNTHAKSVLIAESVGGKETNPLWTSQISNKAYTEALAKSLEKSQVFKTVIRTGQADYTLDVTLLAYSQPWVGLDLDITMKTRWELSDNATHKPAWSETFETTYKAKVSEALVAAERLQKANEGAARTNIAEGIKRLSALKL